ncbi:PREDICTED: nuclear receptor coactivator 5-like [Amphimedon queenslandica]|nr:PREDICTED: nuclear receptor coactivator 5-like [Amphimedon queenslandica]|eukprot:XP_019864327.1 PREDICTED: nuclear receptor coactivator 5-like [Amphimedon queenslandica]
MEISTSSGADRSKIYDRDGTNTSSDDPEMMQSRIFIGNLKTNKVTRKSIENRFSKYGKILGVSLHKSYGFVQFETRDIARKAVNEENKQELHGVKMDICIATERRKPEEKSALKKRGRSRSPRSSRSRRERRSRDDDLMGRYNRYSPPSRMRGPLLDPYRDPYMDPYIDDPYDPYPPPRDMYDRFLPSMRRDYLSPPPPPFMSGDYPLPPRKRRDRYMYDEPWDYPPPPFRERDLPPRERDLPPKRDLPPRERALLPPPPPLREREVPPFRERDLPHREGLPPRRGEDTKPSFAPPSGDKSVPEAQIIIVNTHQKEYAQLVRERIESLGLSVEPLHLSPTVSLAEALENAARRGLMYTVIITSQHEAHRSVTLTILHGRNPQEHKNMPLDDAIGLINRDYSRHCQSSGINPRGGESLGGGGASLMAKAAAGHNLSPAELSQLISSLQQKQQRVGGAGSMAQRRDDTMAPPAANSNDMQQQQADLQAKILSLLGSNAVVPSGGAPASKPLGGVASLFESSRFPQSSFGASSFR